MLTHYLFDWRIEWWCCRFIWDGIKSWMESTLTYGSQGIQMKTLMTTRNRRGMMTMKTHPINVVVLLAWETCVKTWYHHLKDKNNWLKIKEILPNELRKGAWEDVLWRGIIRYKFVPLNLTTISYQQRDLFNSQQMEKRDFPRFRAKV